jgi:hypothetical protein
MKTIILYSFRNYIDSAINFNFFLKNTLPFLSNSVNLVVAYDQDALIDISSNSQNIKYIKTPLSFDLNDFAFLLDNIDYKSYNNFIFLNSSCIGPILPSYVQDNWINLIVKQLSEKTKLVGPVIEVPPDDLGTKSLKKFSYINKTDTEVPFVHTYFFATDYIGVNILFEYGAFINENANKDKLVCHLERLISACILNENYNIKSFLKKQENISWLDKTNWNYRLWSPTQKTCPEVNSNYFNTNIDPYEVMFFKNIRHPNKFRNANDSGIPDYHIKYLNNIFLQK